MGASGRGPAVGENPFVQVALGSMYDPSGVTIITPAIDEASQAISAYLVAPEAGGGRVLAITGEHGMGKTYLAQHLLTQASATPGRRVHTMYLLARNQTFVELYQDFAEQLLKQSSNELLDLVRGIYAAIVAASLRGSELTERLATDLDSGALDPVSVVERYGLAQSDFLGTLQQRLERVTSQPEFSIALTLLLRPEFEASVREWLLGHAPDPLLRERGIGRTLDTEPLALQAMGVFTLLYGHARIPFLLVIDELEQILLRREPDADVMGSFQQLLEIFVRAGGFLMLIGVPESVESLKPGIRQRIGQTVRMRPFTAADASDIIRRSRPGLDGPEGLAPFTPTTIEYLVDLVGGVARTVIKMGHRLYDDAASKGVGVTPAMVRAAVRGEYEVNVSTIVHREIGTVLSASGWPFALDQRIGQPGVPVDYWVEVGEDAHCAVIITDAVLDAAAAEGLQERAESLQAEPGRVEIILIATGVLSANWSSRLTDALRSRPLHVDISSFGEDFAAAFKSACDRLVPPTSATDEPGIRSATLDRVVRQQSNVYRLLGQTSSRLEGFRTASDRQFSRILELLQQIVADQTAQVADPNTRPTLPGDVVGLFVEADASLYQLDNVDTLFRETFRVERGPTALPFRIEQMKSGDILQAVGVGYLLRRLLAAFHDSIGQWYERAVSGEPDPQQWPRLDALCETFDMVVEDLPGLTVDRLGDLTELVASRRSGRRRSVPDVERLGARVKRTLRSSLSPGAS